MQNFTPDWAALANRLNQKFGSDAAVVEAVRPVLPGIQDSYRNQLGAMRRGLVKDPSFSIGAALVWLDGQEAKPVPAGLQYLGQAPLPELERKPQRKPKPPLPAKFSGEWTPEEIAVFRAYLGLGKKELAVLIGYDGVSAARRVSDLENPARREVTRQRVRDAFNWLYDLAVAGKPLAAYPHKQSNGDVAEDPRFERLVEKFGSLTAASHAMYISQGYLSMVKTGAARMTKKISAKIDAALAK